MVIRITINHLGILISDKKLTMTAVLKEVALNSLSSLRADLVHDFVRLTGLSDVVKDDYFFKMA